MTATTSIPTETAATPLAYVLTDTVAPEALVVERGWHADPRSEHELRFHDGAAWTEHVTHFGPVPCRGCNPARN